MKNNNQRKLQDEYANLNAFLKNQYFMRGSTGASLKDFSYYGDSLLNKPLTLPERVGALKHFLFDHLNDDTMSKKYRNFLKEK